jgi:ferric-dicitrate binding protein FerR (iron transport regulator)
MKVSRELLQKYHHGECSAEEIEVVQQWLLTDELDSPNMKSAEEDKHIAEAWQDLSAFITPEKSKTIKFFYWPAGIAASLLLMLLTGYIIYSGRLATLIVEQKDIALPPGRQGTITLTDKSTIQLNAGSTLQYPSIFTGHCREVTLTNGEAFFNISHDTEHPFIVRTDSVRIYVLGTKFNISNGVETNEIHITLTEGSISFFSAGETRTLRPGQQLNYNKHTHTITLRLVNVERVTAWTKGILWFEDTPMPEVFATLEKRYGVVFSTAKKLDMTFTAKFKNESLERVLHLITRSSDLNFKRNKNTITVY